jgi:hypothetical protein
VAFTDANTGTVVGSSGTILRTTNGGTTWTSQVSGTGNGLNGVSFVDANTGIVVGDNGTILYTVNGGTTWIGLASGTTYSLNGVSYGDATSITVVGQYGTVLRSTNGGASWTSQWSGITSDLYAVSFTDGNTGTAVGAQGRILRTNTGGVLVSVGSRINPDVPQRIYLSQNFPNPFNPRTTIVYRVESRESVELRVFDILGREVVTLVNEVQDAGLKSVQWDATGVASGVYFYRLRAGNFVDTKKLVVLR